VAGEGCGGFAAGHLVHLIHDFLFSLFLVGFDVFFVRPKLSVD
jgi:hypothetical protein